MKISPYIMLRQQIEECVQKHVSSSCQTNLLKIHNNFTVQEVQGEYWLQNAQRALVIKEETYESCVPVKTTNYIITVLLTLPYTMFRVGAYAISLTILILTLRFKNVFYINSRNRTAKNLEGKLLKNFNLVQQGFLMSSTHIIKIINQFFSVKRV